MGVKVVQLTSNNHHDNILSSLHDLRLQGQFSDVTVKVDYEGDVQEFQAHQVILAAASSYFKKLLLSQDASQDTVLLSNMHSSDFSKFLEFVYTGKVEIATDKISGVQEVARFLDCEDLSVVCGEALSTGILQKTNKKRAASVGLDTDESHADKAETKTTVTGEPNSLFPKPQVSPLRPVEEVPAKRFRAKKTVPNKYLQKRKLFGHKVLQQHLYCKKEALNSDKKNTNEDTVETEDGSEDKSQPENKEDKGDETSLEKMTSDEYLEKSASGGDLEKTPSDGDDQEPEDDDDVQNADSEYLLMLSDEEEGEEGRQFPLRRTSKAQFMCNKCQRTFHYEKSYLKHISTYHGVKADVVYRCDICSQTFANRSNLKVHEKHVHSNERLFTCDSCTKTFKRKKDVVRHQRQVHERNLRHICTECGKGLSSKTALLLHERTHTGTKPFECSDCGARFTQNAALKMHRRTHTGEKPFACDACDARFTQKHMLAYHKRSHTGEKPFMCDACGKSFASKEYLRHHTNIHTGSKPFKCEQCGRGFAQRNSLNQHLKIHTGERPYHCKDCDKQFTQINALQRHQRIHTGEKPYMCGFCHRTFTDKSTLRRHTAVHDSDVPWKTYLVVLEGNVEEKKPKSSPKGKIDKTRPGEKKILVKKSLADDGDGKTLTESTVESVTLPPEWTSHGAIALVSHGALGGITVIHTEVPPGTQIQPIVTADGTGASVISLDGSTIPVPFTVPVSIAHPVSLSSEASTTLSLPTLSVPVSDGLLAVSEIPTVSTSSVLEAAASQTILAPDTKDTPETLQPSIQTVIVSEKVCEKEQTAVVQSDTQHRKAETIEISDQDEV